MGTNQQLTDYLYPVPANDPPPKLEMTPELAAEVNGYLDRYETIDPRELTYPTYPKLRQLIFDTLTQAPRTLEALRQIHGYIVDTQTRYPRPATIRLYMRENNLSEGDRDI